MIKIFAVCGMGLGTSVVLKSRLKKALDQHDVDYTIDVVDASAANGQSADLIFTSAEFAEKINNDGAQIHVIDNFTDREEISRKVDEALAALGGD